MKSFETSSRVSAIFFVETKISSSMYIKYISSKIPVSPRISSDDSGSINMLRSLSSLRTAVKQSSVIVVADRHVIPSTLHSSQRRRPHHRVFAKNGATAKRRGNPYRHRRVRLCLPAQTGESHEAIQRRHGSPRHLPVVSFPREDDEHRLCEPQRGNPHLSKKRPLQKPINKIYFLTDPLYHQLSTTSSSITKITRIIRTTTHNVE